MFKKRFFGIMWILAAILAVYAFVDQKITKDYATRNPSVEVAANTPVVSEVKKDVISPSPLRASTTPSILKNKITPSEIIALTNIERQKIGLPVLGDNALLDKAAFAKAKDMIAKKYFEHISPSGDNAGNFAEKEGYEYLIIGENIALGGFENAHMIIDAWMKSQGHRENILNSKYREIGAVAVSAKFEGKNVLFAVQIFGAPASLCPRPDTSSKSKIDSLNAVLGTKRQTIDAMYQEINNNANNETYHMRINEYNILVREYNSMVEEAKNLITVYNDQVRQFTECATSLR